MLPRIPQVLYDARPSVSSFASAIGGLLALFISLILQYGCNITLNSEQAIILGSGMAALAGYFFDGGKAKHTARNIPDETTTKSPPE